MIKLYHATASADDAFQIEEEGFKGNDVWHYENVVFLADRPLPGFGGWREAWIEVAIPSAFLGQGKYDEADLDAEIYHAQCYCFTAELINQFPRKVFVDRVPGFDFE